MTVLDRDSMLSLEPLYMRVVRDLGHAHHGDPHALDTVTSEWFLRADLELHRVVSERARALDPARSRNLVRFCQQVLGRQTGCLQLARRTWVWHIDGCFLFVSNQKGLSFEVPPAMDLPVAIEIWQKTKEKLTGSSKQEN